MHKSYKAMSLPAIGVATVILGIVVQVSPVGAETNAIPAATKSSVSSSVATYKIQPGDVLTVSVWKEEQLQAEVLVRPDGGISFPLAGDLQAENQSVEQLQVELTDKLRKYIPDPVVMIAVKATGGSRIYVLGKVNRPGEYPMQRPLDVMQALSLAGGTTPFAALNDIEILRRDGGKQVAIGFRYGDVEKGKALEQNVLLKSGDTVVVP